MDDYEEEDWLDIGKWVVIGVVAVVVLYAIGHGASAFYSAMNCKTGSNNAITMLGCSAARAAKFVTQPVMEWIAAVVGGVLLLASAAARFVKPRSPEGGDDPPPIDPPSGSGDEPSGGGDDPSGGGDDPDGPDDPPEGELEMPYSV